MNGPEDLVRLCETLRDEASMTFPGNAVEQARAIDAHTLQRQKALVARYVTLIPAAGYAFRSYDLGERRLVLDNSRSFVLGDGAELFLPSADQAPGFALGPTLADRVLAQRGEGKVSLRLIFRPTGSQLRKDACIRQGGGRVVKMEIEVIGAALLGPDGSPLARGDTGEYADASIASPVRSPKVTVNKPRTAEGKDVPTTVAASLTALAQKALPCYERVLLVRPALRGTLVLGLRIGAGARIEAPRIEMSSLGDDALSTCVTTSMAKANIPGATAGQRFSVPLQFGSADD